MKQTSYDFISTWRVHAGVMQTERVVLDLASWSEWWRGLVEANITKSDKAVVGSTITMIWKSMLGYRLNLRLIMLSYKPQQYLAFQSEGDLNGTGTWSFKSLPDNTTEMIISWNVRTTKTWMNVLAPVLRPLFIHAHHKLMRQGEVGLQYYLTH